MNIKMIALDLDGTTFDSSGRITERTADAIRKADNKGVHIVVSTGRSYTSLPENIRNLDAVRYAITSNGAHIIRMDTGEAIYSEYLSENAVMRAADLAGELNTYIEIFIDGQAYIDDEYYRHIQKYGSEYRNADYVLWSRKPIVNIIQSLRDNRHRIENINFCFPGAQALEESRPVINTIPDATVTSSFANNLEIGGPNTSKKTALKALMNMLDVTREELMCCGDAPNDIDMIEFAGLGVAVGNAWGGTKEHADYVTGTNDEDGVAQAIEKFVL